jgi:hypothetical protein
MKGHKIVIAAGLGLMAILCLAGAWFAFGAYSKAAKVKASLGGTLRQLQAIYNADPFPNAANRQAILADSAWIGDWMSALGQELRAAQVGPTNNLSPSLFIDKLQSATRALRTLAQAEGTQVFPEGFAFGFDRYLGSASSMPKPEHVQRLAMQLAITDALVRELLASHVSTVTHFEREAFDTGAPVAAADDGGGRRRRAGGAPVAGAPAAAAAAGGRYSRQHFNISFTAREKALVEVLNRLARMSLFAVVTEVSIHRMAAGFQPPPEKSIETDKAKAALLPPGQRIVSGPEMDPVLRATIQVDVFTFEGV